MLVIMSRRISAQRPRILGIVCMYVRSPPYCTGTTWPEANRKLTSRMRASHFLVPCRVQSSVLRSCPTMHCIALYGVWRRRSRGGAAGMCRSTIYMERIGRQLNLDHFRLKSSLDNDRAHWRRRQAAVRSKSPYFGRKRNATRTPLIMLCSETRRLGLAQPALRKWHFHLRIPHCTDAG